MLPDSFYLNIFYDLPVGQVQVDGTLEYGRSTWESKPFPHPKVFFHFFVGFCDMSHECPMGIFLSGHEYI